jgi:hypothetical protein
MRSSGPSGQLAAAHGSRPSPEFARLRFGIHTRLSLKTERVELACLIHDVDDWREVDSSDERNLWQLLHDREDAPEPAWIEGFIDGAIERSPTRS